MTSEDYQSAKDNWSNMTVEEKVGFMTEVSRDYQDQYGLGPDTFNYETYGPDDAAYVNYGNDYANYTDSTDTITFNTDNKSLKDFNESVNTAIHETLHGIDDITGYTEELNQIEGMQDDYDHAYINEQSELGTNDMGAMYGTDTITEQYEQEHASDQTQDGGYSITADPNVDVDMTADPTIVDTSKVEYVTFTDAEAGTVN